MSTHKGSVVVNGVKVEFEESSGNVFEDLGLPNPEERKFKAELAMRIANLMKEKSMTQAQLGELVGLDQPKISKMLRGQLREFSVERLFSVLNRLGRRIEVRVLEVEPENARMLMVA